MVGAVLVGAGAASCAVGLRSTHLELLSFEASATKRAVAVAVGVILLVVGAALLARPARGALRLLTPRRVVPFLIALTVYGGVYAMDWHDEPPSGDEPHYMLEAYSLAIDRDRNLAGDYVNPVRIAPMFGSFAPGSHAFNYSGDPTVAISMHSVGVPALLLPVAATSDDVRLMRIEMILIAVAAAYLLLSILRRVSGSSGALVYATWAAFAFSLPLVSYSSQIYPEIPGLFLLLLATRLLLEERLSEGGTLVAAGAGALMPWFHVRFAYMAVILMAALVYRSLRREPRAGAARGRLRRVLPAAGPFVFSGILLMLANQHWYGSPWPNAQVRLYKPPATFDLHWAYVHSLGGVFHPVFGWLPFAPVHVLALVATIYFCWRGRRWALAGGVLATIYLAFVASAKGIQVGTAFPGRLQLVLIPLAAIPLLLLLRESKWIVALAAPLAGLTWAIAIVGVLHLDLLIAPRAVNVPDLPLVNRLAGLWPALVTPSDDKAYSDWPRLVAWIVGIVLVGSLLALWRREPAAARP